MECFLTTEQEAIAFLRERGYRVTKPTAAKALEPTRKSKARKPKASNIKGPTYVAHFEDGNRVIMTVHCHDHALDYARARRLAQHAWSSRQWQEMVECNRATLSTICDTEYKYDIALGDYCRHLAYAPAPAIISEHFERNGVRLA